MYSAITIANCFIYLGFKKSFVFSVGRLINMIYIAHGLYLKKYQKPLIAETIEGWYFGLSISSVYYCFHNYRNDNPVSYADFYAVGHVPMNYNKNQEILKKDIENTLIINHDAELKKFMQEVFEYFMLKDNDDINDITMGQGTPFWLECIRSPHYSASNQGVFFIKNEVIKNYFKSNNTMPTY